MWSKRELGVGHEMLRDFVTSILLYIPRCAKSLFQDFLQLSGVLRVVLHLLQRLLQAFCSCQGLFLLQLHLEDVRLLCCALVVFNIVQPQVCTSNALPLNMNKLEQPWTILKIIFIIFHCCASDTFPELPEGSLWALGSVQSPAVNCSRASVCKGSPTISNDSKLIDLTTYILYSTSSGFAFSTDSSYVSNRAQPSPLDCYRPFPCPLATGIIPTPLLHLGGFHMFPLQRRWILERISSKSNQKYPAYRVISSLCWPHCCGSDTCPALSQGFLWAFWSAQNPAIVCNCVVRGIPANVGKSSGTTETYRNNCPTSSSFAVPINWATFCASARLLEMMRAQGEVTGCGVQVSILIKRVSSDLAHQVAGTVSFRFPENSTWNYGDWLEAHGGTKASLQSAKEQLPLWLLAHSFPAQMCWKNGPDEIGTGETGTRPCSSPVLPLAFSEFHSKNLTWGNSMSEGCSQVSWFEKHSSCWCHSGFMHIPRTSTASCWQSMHCRIQCRFLIFWDEKLVEFFLKEGNMSLEAAKCCQSKPFQTQHVQRCQCKTLCHAISGTCMLPHPNNPRRKNAVRSKDVSSAEFGFWGT